MDIVKNISTLLAKADQITLQFSNPNENFDYLDISCVGGSKRFTTNYTKGATSVSFFNLIPGTKYVVTLKTLKAGIPSVSVIYNTQTSNVKKFRTMIY